MYPELLESLFAARGISRDEQNDFLNPDYSKLHDPSLLPDIEKASDRVIAAMAKGEHITVFSDYDADGIPGAVVLSDFFRRACYDNISFYIPHRHNEGFGLNLTAIEECSSRSTKLLITVDCGVSDIEEVKAANDAGIDVIITDHHEPSLLGLPPAYAVVNPNRPDSKYPFHGLCGSAVVFKLVQAILTKESFGIKPGLEKWSLDMVSIATLSDMVPLVGENRILSRFGLEVLRKSPRPGIRALLRRLNIEQKNLTEDDITFMITPRINAASRMGVPEDAFNLLRTEDQLEAERLALHLEKINNMRKGVVAGIVKEAKGELAKREKIAEVIVIGNPEWRPALLGLVANSLVEEYERPAFVWGRDGDGMLKGSCRSYNGYDLFLLMNAVSDTLLEFGGHKGAGGFSITLEQLTVLEEKLSEALKTLSSEEAKVENNLSISLSDIGESLWGVVSQFAPFGMGNEKPVFKISNAPIKSVRQFGKANEHLEVTLAPNIKAISFFSSPTTYSLLPTANSCTLLANLEKSYFRNRPELRLRIVGIEP